MNVQERADGTYFGTGSKECLVVRTAEALPSARRSASSVPIPSNEPSVKPRRVSPYFSSPAQQLRHLLMLCQRFDWQIDRQDFLRSSRHVLPTTGAELETLVLVPYLGSVRGTWERLVHAIGNSAAPVFITEELDQAMSRGCLYPEPEQHQPGLRWEAVDLGFDPCQRQLRIEEAAHLAVLAALLVHPAWAHALGRELPPVVLGGYLLPTADGETGHPMVSYDANYGGLLFNLVSSAVTVDAAYPLIVTR